MKTPQTSYKEVGWQRYPRLICMSSAQWAVPCTVIWHYVSPFSSTTSEALGKPIMRAEFRNLRSKKRSRLEDFPVRQASQFQVGHVDHPALRCSGDARPWSS